MSKHSVTIRGLRMLTTWSWAWSNCTSPSKWVGLGSPLTASSAYGDLTCSVHTVNNLCMFNCQCHFYLCNWGPYVRLAFVPNTLSSWNKDIIIIIQNTVTALAFKVFLSGNAARTHNAWRASVIAWKLLSISCYTDRIAKMSRLMTKPTKWHMRPAKTQISLGIRLVWSESSLCAQWVAKAQDFFMRTAKPLIRLGGCPGWSESSLGAQSFCWFCQEAAKIWNW